MALSNMIESLKDSMSSSGYSYSAIPAPALSRRERVRNKLDMLERRSRIFKLSMGALVFTAVIFMTMVYGAPGTAVTSCESMGNCTGTSTHNWGQYSPYFSAPSDIDSSLPEGCKATLVVVLSRHGSRAPTVGKAIQYGAVIERIKNSVTHYGVGVEFIKDYTYKLGSNDLTLSGQKELAESGETLYRRYKDLVGDAEPFIRASDSDRVIMSAHNFTRAFYQAQGRSAEVEIGDILVLPERKNYNNTLDHGTCLLFEDGPSSGLGHEKQAIWREIWAPPIMHRLNEKLPGANLTLEETVYMMDMCPFDTVAAKDGTLSNFCRLFSQEEWYGYDYYESLEKWYAYGSGNPLGSTQGVGYVNELIARLTGAAVEDHTSTNSTLDSAPITFPLDRKIYADFSHDNTMTSVYAALGLYNATEDLPATYKRSPVQAKGFSAAWSVPFGARMYVEKMKCSSSTQELVRVLVNDRVMPLQTCGADKLGRCKLDAFVESLSFAKGGGLWKQCFA